MSQSLSNVLIHIVFSTKKRKNYINKELQKELYAYITTVCKEHESPVQKIGGISDHIHILIALSRSITVAKLVREIKTSSSRWIKTKGGYYQFFSWQNGYGAFSIGHSGIQKCIRYIADQQEHHKRISFQEEFLKLLKKYQVEFDEKYLWN